MRNGYSLLEVLIAMSITMLIGTGVFQLFRQNEAVFHDQNLVTEMQQSARAGLAQTADEIRMAGQGVPVYAATYDASPNEASVAILSGSNSTRINLRAGLAPAESAVVAPSPVPFTLGTPVSVTVLDATGFSDAVGNSPTGRFVYIWGDLGTARWGWVRASIVSITPSAKSVKVVPDSGSASPMTFSLPPTISLEEGIAIYRDSSTGTMKHTTASNMTNPLSPTWAPANDLVTNVTLLNFAYFDKSGISVTPDTLANRARVARVDIRLSVQTTQDLSNHSRPTYAMSLRSIIRSAAIQ